MDFRDVDFRDVYSDPRYSPETPRVIKDVRDDLRSRMSEYTIDLDEESIMGEVDRLANHQDELQKELQAVMQVVQIVEFDDEDRNDDDYNLRDSLRSLGSVGSVDLPPPPTDENDDDQLEESEEEKAPHQQIFSPIRKRMSFAKAFFKLSKPKTEGTLEQQKQRQKEIVKEELSVAHPGLEDIMEIQEEMQREIVQEQKDILADKKEKENENLSVEGRLPREEERTEKKRISLEEEKTKQMEMLAKKLKDIDPDLIQAMKTQKSAQAEIIAKKEEELRLSNSPHSQRRGRLTQTRSTKNFWDGAMNRLEGIEWNGAISKLENIVGRTPRVRRRKAPETIAEDPEVEDGEDAKES
eukprot:scaffold683_cov124-Cylindrotheca_fusiformis.AAC.26